MNAIKTALITVCVFVLVIGFIGYQQVLEENPNFWAEYEQQQADPAYQAQKAEEDEANAEMIEPYLWGAFGLFLVFVFGGDFLRAIGKPLIVLMGFIAILGAVAYFAGYADKNADGAPDYQDVRMVQPTGNDAENDTAYASVNEENSRATMMNRMSLGFTLVLVSICIFMLGFVSIYLGSWKKEI